MKKILLLLFIATSIQSFSQTKKHVVKKKLSESDVVKADAVRWFKGVYVENNFKDPYSYKLLKSSIIPISLKEGIDTRIEDAERSIERTDTSEWGSEYKKRFRDYKTSEWRHNNNFKSSDSLKESYLLSKRSLDYELKIMNLELKKYQDFINARDSLIKLKNSLTPSKAAETFYYIVYIDCYSNNSYGNPVLGKYAFHYDKNGLVREPIRLNNE